MEEPSRTSYCLIHSRVEIEPSIAWKSNPVIRTMPNAYQRTSTPPMEDWFLTIHIIFSTFNLIPLHGR